LKYPLEENVKENATEEARCLEQLEACYQEWQAKGKDIACTIVEPIQSEGGDAHASNHFFREVTRITKKYGAFMIADEVQTGFGATGTLWGVEHWKCDVDMVTFAKKAQASGFFYHDEFLPHAHQSVKNTYCGEPIKLVMMNAVLNIIQRDNLLQYVTDLGKHCVKGFQDIGTRQAISNARGKGTILAFDLPSGAERDRFIKEAEKQGLIIGGCGPRAIRLRPSLNMPMDDADKMLELIEKTAKEGGF